MKNKPATLACAAALTLGALGLTGTAQAGSISGTVSFSGTAVTDSANFMTSTRFLSFQDVFVGANSALFGDYTGTSGAAVTVTPFIWNPANASTPIDPLWTFTVGAKTYSFDISSIHEDFADPTGMLLSGMGTAFITGETPTSGEFMLSAQTIGVATFTFSSTTEVPVPDNANTVMLLGGVLFSCALVQRKFKKV
ncbi:MAG TPA: hypothetical protein VH413_00445 [Verrucomicrobiae bacterium]|nr:hypothetical protein [Verrucomicrobiae bacterium]